VNVEGQPTFGDRALKLKEKGGHGVIVAAESYGQGSSREHAALCPMYLGVKAVIAKTIERIHFANLINFAIVPITFANPADYDKISEGDAIEIPNLLAAIEKGDETVTVKDTTQGFEFTGKIPLSVRQRKILLAGGLLPMVKSGK
jgi:aconitate hydratase